MNFTLDPLDHTKPSASPFYHRSGVFEGRTANIPTMEDWRLARRGTQLEIGPVSLGRRWLTRRMHSADVPVVHTTAGGERTSPRPVSAESSRPQPHTQAFPRSAAVGVQIGGWHDFRPTLSRTSRRAGIHPVVIKDTLHHRKVDLAMNVYDKASVEDIPAGLRVASKKLLGEDLLPKNLLPAFPKQGESYESAA
jgi:hypothetical protein